MTNSRFELRAVALAICISAATALAADPPGKPAASALMKKPN